jgi:methylmalonyl-CoA/ethylmalonyl-CoA epimerase
MALEWRPHHCGMVVPELEAAVAWYKRILGFKESERFNIPHAEAKVCMLERNGFYLELFEVSASRPMTPDRRTPHSDLKCQGIKHLAIAVKNLDAAIRWLESENVSFASPLIQFDDKKGIFIHDQAGAIVELVEAA